MLCYTEVMWVCLCISGHIHCSCSTVMALLCISASDLVSLAIPICPILIQRHLLVAIFNVWDTDPHLVHKNSNA